LPLPGHNGDEAGTISLDRQSRIPAEYAVILLNRVAILLNRVAILLSRVAILLNRVAILLNGIIVGELGRLSRRR